MCGIIGCVGVRDARDVLVDGLRRLEYRGYDSAGLVVVHADGLGAERVVGRVAGLSPDRLTQAGTGIAHTRWATHGPPSEANAHPHRDCKGRVAVVHNGIIENHGALRRRLEAEGHRFASDTDSEVVAHLIEDLYAGDLRDALTKAASMLEGTYAILAVHADRPDTIVAVRQSSPLVLGDAGEAVYLASDVVAFRAHTDRVVYLEDGDVVEIRPGEWHVHAATPRTIEPVRVTWGLDEATLAGFPHFLLKEIHDQPRALHEALVGRARPGVFPIEGAHTLDGLAERGLWTFVACGSSYHAALVGEALLTEHAGAVAKATLASEYRPPPVRPSHRGHHVVVAITQSGETADTLGALRAARMAGHATLAFANVVGSSITRLADAWIPLRAGPEVSVAATKSFTSQTLMLHALSLQVAGRLGTIPASDLAASLDDLARVPTRMRAAIADDGAAAAAGRWLAQHDAAFVLGRGVGHPLALETALKIKEVSYVHAEGHAAGELKHGPLALVEEGTPTLAFAPRGDRFQEMLSAMREVAARGGRVLGITDDPDAVTEAGFEAIAVPNGPTATFVYPAAAIGQLIAYHASVARGCDVDRPRNLAKSVTVG